MEELKKEFTEPARQLWDAAVEYIDLRISALKLSIVEGLSVGLGGFLSMLLFVGLAIIGFTLMSMAAVLLLGELIGSYALAAFIMAMVFLTLAVLTLWLGRKFFMDALVRMFHKIFFADEKDE